MYQIFMRLNTEAAQRMNRKYLNIYIYFITEENTEYLKIQNSLLGVLNFQIKAFRVRKAIKYTNN